MGFLFISKSFKSKKNEKSSLKKYLPLIQSSADMNSLEIFLNFTFNVKWMKAKKFWNEKFDERVKSIKNDQNLPPLKVFVLPHSHNDPGWIMTYKEYYDKFTKDILDNIVKKLTEYQEMTFVWTEISFLDLWWQSATIEQKESFKKLVNDGRLEIMTGGYVMTDEANVHLYAMLDQLIEGHQWVKSYLNITPKIGWSIDPFGQGSTVPHLLAKSGFEGAIIQRIHYNWKEYFARYQQGDFYWKSHWTTPRSSEYTLLTHNMPFDIYTTQNSCGPDDKSCALFNFRHIPGDYNKNKNEISENNVKFYSNLLINLYRKTASLFPHNVALILLGEDFAYANENEFDQQYSNYIKLFNYINSHSNEEFNGATVQFGTASDYFNEIKKRQGDNFPTFIGDFFPYADIYNTGEPNYWTGFYTTRPFYKLLSRELEHNLRNSEILFTICFNKMRQLKENSIELKILQRNYGKIVKARKNLGLFQHHDAITGTSKQYVMKDYQKMLENSIKETINVQRNFIEILSTENLRNFLELESERSPKSSLKMKKVIEIKKEESKKILLFNSLSHDRYEVISVHVSSSYVSAFDSKEKLLNSQINPIFINGKISSNIMELLILIFIPALSIKIIELREGLNQTLADERTSKILTGDLEEIFIENSQTKLIFDSDSGFLNSMIQKQLNEELKLQISFDAYQSVPKKSGAYLFRPFRVYEEFFESYIKKTIYIVNGPIASEVTVIYGNLLKHTLKIFNTQTYLDDVISINNVIDFEDFQKGNMKDKEMIMRIKSSTANINVEEEREFFTDLNGFQFQPRKTTRKLEIEGNYYPITSLIFIQDEIQRLSLLTTHAQGATSSDHGVIEVMLDRKIMMDDGYGMGEGIFVNPKTEQIFLLTLENFKKLDEDRPEKQYHVPSLLVHHLTNSLNYPVTYFIVGHKNKNIKLNEMKLFNFNLSCDVNFINFRTMSDIELDWLPTENSLLILHRVGFDYYLNNENFSEQICKNYENDFQSLQFVNKVRTKKIQMTSLTGTESGKFIKTFTNDMLEPMEIKTFKITFY